MSTDAKDDTPNELPNNGANSDFTADMARMNVPDEPLRTTNILAPGMSSSTLIAGRYQLLEKIGEGGMGEVWVAQQTQPLKRRVAVKLIRPGMGSRAFLARFEQERQALASAACS